MLHTRAWVLLFAVILITAVLLLLLRHPGVSRVLHEKIPDRPKRRLLLAAVAFFLTFAAARSLAYANHHQLGPFHDIFIRGRHIHHLVWGILLLIAVGFGWLMEHRPSGCRA